MNKLSLRFLVLFSLLFSALFAMSQERKITPVDSDDKKPKQPTLHYYDKHGEPLETPVLFLSELDTVKSVKSVPTYPLYDGISVGMNFADAVMMAIGQKHASFDIRAAVSLHNWFFPVVEAGLGFANSHPEDGNFHYVSPPSLYFKVGLNYNFLYKSNPDYQVFLGLRAGYSSFSYHIDDINISSSYWGETESISIPNQHASALWGEALAGLKVKIYRNISLGWDVRYRFKFHSSSPSNSTPWFIPGYGASSPIRLCFSVYYDFTKKRKNPELITPDS